MGEVYRVTWTHRRDRSALSPFAEYRRRAKRARPVAGDGADRRRRRDQHRRLHPHISPGLYDNTGPEIRAAVAKLQTTLDNAEIPLILAAGADTHLAPNLLDGLRSGAIPRLGSSRYFLLEPPQSVLPPAFRRISLRASFAWLRPDYHSSGAVAHGSSPSTRRSQAWSGRASGYRSPRAPSSDDLAPVRRHWSMRLLDDGLVHVIASDAHNTDRTASAHGGGGRCD